MKNNQWHCKNIILHIFYNVLGTLKSLWTWYKERNTLKIFGLSNKFKGLYYGFQKSGYENFDSEKHSKTPSSCESTYNKI